VRVFVRRFIGLDAVGDSIGQCLLENIHTLRHDRILPPPN
jgi:hypothetical protein